MRSLAARPCNPALTPFIVSFHYHESEMPLCLERIVPNGPLFPIQDDEGIKAG